MEEEEWKTEEEDRSRGRGSRQRRKTERVRVGGWDCWGFSHSLSLCLCLLLSLCLSVCLSVSLSLYMTRRSTVIISRCLERPGKYPVIGVISTASALRRQTDRASRIEKVPSACSDVLDSLNSSFLLRTHTHACTHADSSGLYFCYVLLALCSFLLCFWSLPAQLGLLCVFRVRACMKSACARF